MNVLEPRFARFAPEIRARAGDDLRQSLVPVFRPHEFARAKPRQGRIEPVRIQYLIWYTPQTKRYVKMQRRVISASGAENEKDVFELVAHR